MKNKTTERSVIILENGEQVTIPLSVAERLVTADLIHLCTDCGIDMYHVNSLVGDTLDDLERALQSRKFPKSIRRYLEKG